MRQIPRQGPLTEREMSWAKTAWSYFQNNVNPVTGLAGAQPNYSPFTMWDLSAHMAAILSANELGLIDDKEFDSRMRKIISWLNVMELFAEICPISLQRRQWSNGGLVQSARCARLVSARPWQAAYLAAHHQGTPS